MRIRKRSAQDDICFSSIAKRRQKDQKKLIATTAIAFALATPALAQGDQAGITDTVKIKTKASETVVVNTDVLEAEFAKMTPAERQAFNDASETEKLDILAARGMRLQMGFGN